MRSAVMVLSLAAASLAGCSTGSSPGTDPAGDPAAQERLWQAQRLDSYRFDFEQQCFCVREQVQPVTIEVRDGRIARVTSRETGQDLTGFTNLRWYTVDDLFGIVARAREDAVQPLVVRYDSSLGYPTYIEAGSLAADAGVIYSAANLQPLR